MSYTPRFRIVTALAALFLLLPLQPVEAADIRVILNNSRPSENCLLVRAIASAVYNTQQSNTNCAIGDSDKEDTIILPKNRTIVWKAGVPISDQISGSVTIEGNGSTINYNGNRGNLFIVQPGSIFTLNNVTITNIHNSFSTRDGTAIYAKAGGTVILNNSRVTGNAVGRNGGGIYVAGGTVTLNNSTVSNNTAGSTGGGIYVASGSLTLNNSTVSGNTAVSNSNGGGIYVASGKLTLNNSAVSGNTVSTGGGGIYMGNGTLNIENSTISGNKADASGIGEGGGLYIYAGATATLRHVTIAMNEAKTVGGGIYKAAGSTLNLYNSIIADNETGQDCWLEPVQEGDPPVTIEVNAGNLIGDDSCSNVTVAVRGDPMLGGLTDSPPYHPLASGSPARDAAAAAHCLETDQRGKSRPYGEFCDIGAFEWHPSPPPAKKGSGRTVAPTPAVSTCLTLARVAVNGISESTQCQRVNAILNGIQGSIDAVDVWGWVLPNTQICFEASGGSFKFIDTSAMPRTMSDLSAFSLNGMTCAVIHGPGIVVLLPGDAPPARVGQSAAPPSSRALSGCMVRTDYMLRFRDGPGGEIIMSMVDPWGYPMNGFLPPSVTLTALERTADWFKVDYYGTQGWVSAGHVSPQGACG